MCDDAGSLRGVRRSQGKSTPRRYQSLNRSPCLPPKPTTRPFHESSQRTTTSRRGSPRRAAPVVHNNNDEVRGRTDRQAMIKSDTSDSDTGDPTGQPVRPPKRGAKRVGIGLILKNAAPRPTMQSKMCGRFFSTNYNAPHPPVGRPRSSRDWLVRPTTPRPTHTTWEGTSRLTPPSGGGKTGAVRWEIAAPTTSAGGRGPSRGRDFRGPGNGCRGWRSSGV